MKTEVIYDTKGNKHVFNIAETYSEKQAASERMNADPDFYDGFGGYRDREEERAKAKKEKHD